MMNSTQHKLLWMFAGFLSVLPAGGYASDLNLASEPLWMGSSVKHNVMLALDDSGSMDFEILFDNNDGALYLGDDGMFTSDNTGTYNSSGDKYVYLFPNGRSRPYDGSRLYGPDDSHYAIPPKRAYAFSRSSDYNASYYDPNQDYPPWPSYGGFTFTDADTSATPFEVPHADGAAGASPDTLNLFADFTPSDTYWGFDVMDDDMVCDDDGNKCGEQTDRKTDFTYYPATYYLKDTSTSFSYLGSDAAHSSNSVLIEAEDATYADPFFLNTTMEGSASGAELTALQLARTGDIGGDGSINQDGASGGEFVGVFDSKGPSTGNVPDDTAAIPEGEVSLNFKVSSDMGTGTYKIWLRVFAQDDSRDSFWINLHDFDRSQVTLSAASENEWDLDADTTDPGQDWNQLRDAIAGVDDEWQWVEWGSVDLVADTSYELNVRRREPGTYLDQVFISNNSSFTPAGIMTLSDKVVSCDDSNPTWYPLFVQKANDFTFADSGSTYAIGPDGSCLKEYKITGSDSAEFDNGSTERTGSANTVAVEKQNFANWFTYHRRRHQSMRYGVAAAMQDIGGIRTGLFWINDRSDVTMYDMDDSGASGDLNSLLKEHYGHVNSGGTNLRSTLQYAAEQFKRTDSDAPIVRECQKNFTLLFTDGYASLGDSVSDVGNADGSAEDPYKDAYDDTLADVAYKYYTENLVPSLPTGEVAVSSYCGDADADPSLDCNRNLHMNTYTVSLGTKGGVFGVSHDDVADAYVSTPSWPDVNAARDRTQIDDLYHAAINGRGEMFRADSTGDLPDAIKSAFKDIVDEIGSGSGVTFNTSSLEQDSVIYTTFFNATNWSGDVVARALDPTSGEVLDSVWEQTDENGNVEEDGVAGYLDSRDLTTDDRVILTYGNTDGVAFQWANLTTDQQADLKTASDGSTESDAIGEDRLDFIRGDVTNDSYRDRGSRMGDVIHSAPVYVGVPASGWPDQEPFGVEADNAGNGQNLYSDFRNRTQAEGGAKDRTPVIYVGANDGMLHGFNAESTGSAKGQEVIAYIPESVYSTDKGAGLHYLTDPNYDHRYYVDLTPVAQDVYIERTTGGAKDWRTVLVGGLRTGGRGIFALDVTDPSEFSESGTTPSDVVLWEFSDADDDDMGYLTSTPSIGMMNNGMWAVIFGNGYNSKNGEAKLMILFIEEGLDGNWAAGNYVEISTGVGTSTDKNGLSGVASADLDGDSIIDRIYAGDLEGNMWAFDVSNASEAKWDVAYSSGSGSNVVKEPLLTSYHDANNNGSMDDGEEQPITAAPNLLFNTEASTTGNEPNVLVTFGTGQYLADGDHDTTVSVVGVQSYYTVWDKGAGELETHDLSERTFSVSGDKTEINEDPIVWESESASESGWYFDMDTDDGERVRDKPLLAPDGELGPVAIFSTLIPNTDECAGGGSSKKYFIPVLSGSNPTKAIADLDGDGDIDDDDIGIATSTDAIVNTLTKLGKNVYGSEGTGGGVQVTETTLSGGSDREGRLGWHELIDE